MERNQGQGTVWDIRTTSCPCHNNQGILSCCRSLARVSLSLSSCLPVFVEEPVHHIDGINFLLVNYLCVYLCGRHVLVTEQLAHRVDVNSYGQHHRRVAVAAT